MTTNEEKIKVMQEWLDGKTQPELVLFTQDDIQLDRMMWVREKGDDGNEINLIFSCDTDGILFAGMGVSYANLANYEYTHGDRDSDGKLIWREFKKEKNL